MIGSEAVTLLKQRAQRNTAGTTLDSWIESELKQAQIRLERGSLLPWFLITERSFEEMTKDDERVMVPSLFLREVDTEMMQVEDTANSGTRHDVNKRLYENIRTRYPAEEKGRPRQYALVGEYFRCRPIPDIATYILWMVYYEEDEVFDLTKENLWLKYFPDLLIAEAGMIVAGGIQNPSAAIFANMQATEIARMKTDNTARAEMNADPNPEN